MAEKLTRDELATKLEEQIELLQSYAEMFDKGTTVTTLPMATAIRVLFHDTNNSVSLIKHICDADGKDKNAFEMITTKEPENKKAKQILLGDGLYLMSFRIDGLTYLPKLSDSTHTKLTFNDWWNEAVIKNVCDGFENAKWMTREELITLHANKEGGAHVDEKKNKRISEIGTQSATGWRGIAIYANGNSKSIEDIIDQKKASIRQICYEVLVSLHNHFPESFKCEYF